MKTFKRIMIFFVVLLTLISCSSAQPSKGDLISGTFKGAGKGFKGDIEVTLELKENVITNIDAKHHETPSLGDNAINNIIDEMKSKNSVDVDIVASATRSSKGIKEAVTNALKEAGLDPSALKANSATVKVEDEVKEADVVVIGGGGAGLSAATAALEEGASVILIDKMPSLGGNTLISGAAINAADPEKPLDRVITANEKATIEGLIKKEVSDPLVKQWQSDLKAEFDKHQKEKGNKFFDSTTLHKLQTYFGGDMKGDPKLIEILCQQAPDALHRLKSLGMEFNEKIFTVLGGLWDRAREPKQPLGTGYINTYKKYIESKNGTILLETKAEKLLLSEDGSKVVGVLAKGKAGNTITLKANRGVVLATGGFGNNPEMREKYNTVWPSLKNLKSTNSVAVTGDGITMAEAIGAKLVGMEYIQLLPMGDPKTGSLSGNIEQGVQNRIFVNLEGKRFVDEGARRDVMTKALLEQPEQKMFSILDKHSYPTEDVKNHFNESIAELLAAKRAFKADTLEELAKLIGVDANNLKAAVEDFNKHVAEGSVDSFGRTLFAEKIDTPPFYAGMRTATVHHTMGGVAINELAQVLNKEGKVIVGLYAAGEVTGGIHGTNRLGGNALSDINVFGRIAGSNAAKNK